MAAPSCGAIKRDSQMKGERTRGASTLCSIVSVALGFWLSLSAAAVCAQVVAFSFDDGFDPRVQPQAAQWNAQLLETLRATDVQAVLFPAAGRVDSSEGLALVRAWGEAGHLIANHTYSHRNLNAALVLPEDFTADIGRADDLLRDMPGWTAMFRFPYLKEGNDAAERDAVRTWLAHNGYQPAPPSIDASDWYYNRSYLEARERCSDCDLSPLKRAYVAHLLDRASYYDGLARKVLGRSPRHVLLLHSNAINAQWLGDVVAAFRDAGWKIVTPSHAYRDPMYATAPQTVPAGESIVWALAKERGLPGLRYPAEDGRYEQSAVDSAMTAIERKPTRNHEAREIQARDKARGK